MGSAAAAVCRPSAPQRQPPPLPAPAGARPTATPTALHPPRPLFAAAALVAAMVAPRKAESLQEDEGANLDPLAYKSGMQAAGGGSALDLSLLLDDHSSTCETVFLTTLLSTRDDPQRHILGPLGVSSEACLREACCVGQYAFRVRNKDSTNSRKAGRNSPEPRRASIWVCPGW